jgi:hypothetical protein
MKKSLTAALLATCFAGAGTVANATTMVQLSTPQMVDAATSIVRGTITEVWTEEDDKGIVWTRAQLEVSKTYKGDSTKNAYIIDQMGGQFGGNISSVLSAARFSAGEEGVFFLEHLGSGRTTTVGLSQGKFTLRLDPYSAQTIVQRFVPPIEQAYDHRFIPLPTEAKRVFLIDLEETIENRVAAGWDGKAIPGVSLDRLQRINVKGSVQ